MLTGDLSEFSLREILQFLASTAASGVLELRSVASHAAIAVHDGGICVALLDIDSIRGLAARLVRAGVVDLDALSVTGDGSIDGVGLAAALAGMTRDRTATERIYHEHTCETLTWLTRRQTATFAFAGAQELASWPFDAAEVATVLAEVDDGAAAWSAVLDTVSDLTLVVSAVPDRTAGQVELTADQWRVIAFVDGRRPVKDVIELSGIGHLQACRELQALEAAALVELVERGGRSTLDAVLHGLGALNAPAPHAVGGTATSTTPAPTVDAPVRADADGVDDGEPAVPVTGPDPRPDIASPRSPSAEPPSDEANQRLLRRLLGSPGGAQ